MHKILHCNPLRVFSHCSAVILLLYMHYASHDNNKITYIATGSAVMPPTRQSVERLSTFHTHCHFIVTNPTRGTLPQLCILYLKKQKKSVSSWKGSTCPVGENKFVPHSATVTLCDTDRYFLHFFRRIFEWLIFLLKDFNGLPESLKDKNIKSYHLHSINKWFYIGIYCDCTVLSLPLSSLPCPVLSWKRKK